MSNAGRRSRATPAATSATTAPPSAIDTRKRCGKTARHNIAAATVIPLNSTVRPAVTTVAWIASGAGAPPARSSRKRETNSRL
jgi:hypothetical protein